MKSNFFLALCLFFSCFWSKDHAFSNSPQLPLESFFKPVGEKKGNHSMPNIDFIYMINLDQRPEKLNFCNFQLHPYGIYPHRFSAVNGWHLSIDDLSHLGVRFHPSMNKGQMGNYYVEENEGQPSSEFVHQEGRTYFCHGMSRGAVGIALSHLSILQDAFNSGYETIWIMEDDIQVLKEPTLISSLIEQLDKKVGKNKWDILYTDQDTKNHQGNYVPCTAIAWRPNFQPKNPNKFKERKIVSSNFRTIGARYGTYSYIIRRSGMEKILNYYKTYRIFLPYDLDLYFAPDLRMYTVLQDVVSTYPYALSDNGAPHYLNKAEGGN